MVQLENEYGSYGDVSKNENDFRYMLHLYKMAKSLLGEDVIIYTTDGGDLSYITRGSLRGLVYAVGDFGPGEDPNISFNAQRKFNLPGMSPPMCSEFYTGWLTHWGESMANTSSADTAQYLDKILSLRGSVSLYMAHGGTNFGFWSGANGQGTDFEPHITSYDYNAPITEAGDHGYGSDGIDKFVAIKNVVKKYSPISPEPQPIKKHAYGNVTFTKSANLMDQVFNGPLATNTITNLPKPSYMEAYDHFYGFICYSLYVTPSFSSSASSSAALEFLPQGNVISFSDVADRIYVFLDSTLVGLVERTTPKN